MTEERSQEVALAPPTVELGVVHGSRPTELDWAWLAGFVDGEGSIGVHRATDDRSDVRRYSYRPALQISSTNKAALVRSLWVMDAADRCLVPFAARTERHAEQWHINIRERRPLIRILNRLWPHLCVKHMQAAFVLDFCERREAVSQKGRGRYAPFSPQDRCVYDALAILNQRGPDRPVVPERRYA